MPLSDLDDDVGAAIDAAFGEEVLITPRKGRVSGKVPDPDHPAVSIVATFTEAPDTPRAFEDRREGISAKGVLRVATLNPVLTVARFQEARLSRPLEEGDLVTLTDRPGSPAYAVNHPGRDDLGALMVTLTREIVP